MKLQSLKREKRELFCLFLGPSGCGKIHYSNQMGGFLREPDSEISILDGKKFLKMTLFQKAGVSTPVFPMANLKGELSTHMWMFLSVSCWFRIKKILKAERVDQVNDKQWSIGLRKKHTQAKLSGGEQRGYHCTVWL